MKENFTYRLKEFTRVSAALAADEICRQAELAVRKNLSSTNLNVNVTGWGTEYGLIREIVFSLIPRTGVLKKVPSFGNMINGMGAFKLRKPELPARTQGVPLNKDRMDGELSLLPIALKQAQIKIEEILSRGGGAV